MGALKSAVRAFCIAPQQEHTLFAGTLGGMSAVTLFQAPQDIYRLGYIASAQLRNQLLLLYGLPSASVRVEHRGNRLTCEFFGWALECLIFGPDCRQLLPLVF